MTRDERKVSGIGGLFQLVAFVKGVCGVKLTDSNILLSACRSQKSTKDISWSEQ